MWVSTFNQKQQLITTEVLGNADYDAIFDQMKKSPFKPLCCTNIDKQYGELEQYLEIQNCVPRMSWHRQQLAPWIKPSTSK